MIKWDGHTHTQFCPHGNGEELRLYLDRAVELGFDRYTVSEHPPLPEGWLEDEKLFFKEIAMEPWELPAYFDHVLKAKEDYQGKLEVTVGLELDFLPGQESFSLKLIEPWSHLLDDLVVSVHYLPGTGGMRCIDYTTADFRKGLIEHYGSMERVVEEYYRHVELAIEFAAGLPGRKRIGHINLIEKFAKELPPVDPSSIEHHLKRLLPKLVQSGVGVDVNTAGLRVSTCGKPYVPAWFIGKCIEEGVPCVFGSDAHRPSHVGQDWEWFERTVKRMPFSVESASRYSTLQYKGR